MVAWTVSYDAPWPVVGLNLFAAVLNMGIVAYRIV